MMASYSCIWILPPVLQLKKMSKLDPPLDPRMSTQFENAAYYSMAVDKGSMYEVVCKQMFW